MPRSSDPARRIRHRGRTGCGCGQPQTRPGGGLCAAHSSAPVEGQQHLLHDAPTFHRGLRASAGVGIVMMSKFSGRPIVPFAVATSKFVVLPTWSRMTINLPFSKLAVCDRRADLGAGRGGWGRARRLSGQSRSGTQSRDRSRLCPRGRQCRPRDAAAPAQHLRRGLLRPGVALKAYKGATAAFGMAAPMPAQLAIAAGQGRSCAARRAVRTREPAASRWTLGVVPRRQRR